MVLQYYKIDGYLVFNNILGELFLQIIHVFIFKYMIFVTILFYYWKLEHKLQLFIVE